MSTFDSYPGKLPSIAMLSQCQQQEFDNAYSQETVYSNFMPNTGLYANSTNHTTTEADMQLDLYNPQHLSPPLTPAVSPPTNIVDQMKFKRKYSVDVGPFGFNAHPSLAHDQDPYRRSSCSAMSVIDECDHPSLNYHDYTYMNNSNDLTTYLSSDINDMTMIHHHNIDHDTSRKNSNLTKTSNTGKRKSAQHCQQGSNAPHKHICKYSYCGWSFKRYEHLKRHMLVHTGERPHVCTYPGCGKSFSRSDNFHAHYRTHTKKQSLDNNANQPSPLHHSTGMTAGITRRGSKKSNAALEINLNAGIATSPSFSSSSSSTSSSQHELIHGFNSSHPFEFNGKPFDLPYNDLYDQQPFADEVNDPQSYIRIGMAPHGGVTSLLNHDQASSSMFSTTTMMTPSYDLPDNYTSGFHSTTEIPPPSPTSPTTVTNQTPVKKQRKPRSTTTTTTSLQYNNQTETGQQKAHVCPMAQCQRRFKRLEHLKRHMRIHTLERPFACTFPKCHKHFSRSDNLSQHMKTHQHRPDKRRQSASTSSSSTTTSSSSSILSPSSSSSSPRSNMNDFESPTQHQTSTMGVYSDACWTLSSEFIGC